MRITFMKKCLIVACLIGTFFTLSASADIVMTVCSKLGENGLQIRYTLLKNGEWYRLLKESYGYNAKNEATRNIEFLDEKLKCSINPDYTFACETIFTYPDYAHTSNKFIISKNSSSQSYYLDHSLSWREYRTGVCHKTSHLDEGLMCSKGSI